MGNTEELSSGVSVQQAMLINSGTITGGNGSAGVSIEDAALVTSGSIVGRAGGRNGYNGGAGERTPISPPLA